MIARAQANRCRFQPGSPAGHYESYFVRANHPRRALAFWIRYTLFSPKGRPRDAVGELWAVYFDGERERITAARQAVPLGDCALGDAELDLRIGAARLDDAFLSGAAASGAHAIAWSLSYTGAQAPLLLLPEAKYESAFPPAKTLVPAPNASFGGELRVDGERIAIDGWRGSQNHNWGSRHTDNYAWGQVAGFDEAPEAFLECSTARLKLGPFRTPPLTQLVLRAGGAEFSFTGVAQALRTRGRFDFFRWNVAGRSREVAVTLRISAPPSAFAGLRYPNPPGGAKTCLNSKLATCELTLERRGQPLRHYRAHRRAAFEILTDRQDHGIPILA